MRTRALCGLVIALTAIGGAVALWPSNDAEPGSVDTVDLTVDENGEDAEGSEPVLGDGTGTHELVELRSTSDGVDLRVYRSDADSEHCGATQVRVGVSTERAVGIVGALLPLEPDGHVLENSVIGNAEGDRVVVVVGRVAPEIIEVSAAMNAMDLFDQTAPVDGLVALALHTGVEPVGPVTVNLTAADGTLEIVEVASSSDRLVATTCPQESQPPASEAVPSEQPGNPLDGDRPADRAAIVEVYGYWYNADVPIEDKAGALDDATGVIEASLATYESYGSTIDTAAAFVDGIEFTSETEAQVAFHIDVGDSPSYFVVTGRAVLVDGSWRITRDTVCPLIANAGVSCD